MILTRKLLGAGGLVGGGAPPSGDDYWVVEVSDVRRLGDVLVNSSNDVIAAFEDAQAVAVVSLDKDGVENWQKKYAYSTYDSTGFKFIAVDSSDNIYISTAYNLGLGASLDIALLKTSASTQAVLAQAGISSSSFDTMGKVSVDSSNNIYQTLYYNDGTVSVAGLAKYDSSLSLDWIYKFNDGTNSSLFRATTVDSSGYIYAGGYTKDSTYTYDLHPYLVKLNSSGVVQWSIKTTNTISTIQNGEDYGGYIRDIIVDSSDNVYISISTTVSGSGFTKRLHILKFNSSGTVQWHKQFSSTATYPAGACGNNLDMCITTGGVLVACWDDQTEFPATTAIVGLDPSDGSISWQRNINKPNYSSLHAHPLGGWCFSVASYSSPYGGYIARLPDDGSLTGNWGLSYESSSRWTSATGGMSWGSSSISAASDSPTETTPSYAAATSSYTLTKTTDPIPPALNGFVTKAVTSGSDWNSGNVLDVLSIADEGDLVVIAFSADNSTTSWSWQGMSFTAIENLTSQSSPGTYVGYRIVQAGDSNPYLGGSSSNFARLTAIAAIFKPTYTTFENSDYSNGSGNSLDPPSVTATAGLWIITGHLDDDYNSTFTAPSGYELIGTAGDPSVGSGTCICYKEESLTSENPGAITSSTSDSWFAVTAAFS